MKEICHFVKELWPKKIGFQPNECRSFLALPAFWFGTCWKPTNQPLHAIVLGRHILTWQLMLPLAAACRVTATRHETTVVGRQHVGVGVVTYARRAQGPRRSVPDRLPIVDVRIESFGREVKARTQMSSAQTPWAKSKAVGLRMSVSMYSLPLRI